MDQSTDRDNKQHVTRSTTKGRPNSDAIAGKGDSKEEKLKKALRANLQRRKAKARALKGE